MIPLTEPIDLKQVRQQTEEAQEGLSPDEVKDHEKNLLRGVFEAWPELAEGGCEVLNELFRQQVAIAQAADDAPMRVKAARADALRLAVEKTGAQALNDLLARIDTNNREILQRVRVLRADRDAARAELATLKGAMPSASE